MSAQEWHELADPIRNGSSYYEHARKLLRLPSSRQPPIDGFPPPDADVAHRPRPPAGSELDELFGAMSRVITGWPPGRGALVRLDELLLNLRLTHDRRELRARILAREDFPKDRLGTLGRWGFP